MRLSVFALVCLFLTACATREKGRERISFNQEWRFALTEKQANASAPDTDDSNWRVLNLPHDWSIEADFSLDNPATPGGGALPGGMGWYRKHFKLPESDKGKVIYIDFDGVYQNTGTNKVKEGYIGLQSEGKEVQFRNVTITPW